MGVTGLVLDGDGLVLNLYGLVLNFTCLVGVVIPVLFIRLINVERNLVLNHQRLV